MATSGQEREGQARPAVAGDPLMPPGNPVYRNLIALRRATAYDACAHKSRHSVLAIPYLTPLAPRNRDIATREVLGIGTRPSPRTVADPFSAAPSHLVRALPKGPWKIVLRMWLRQADTSGRRRYRLYPRMPENDLFSNGRRRLLPGVATDRDP